MHNTAKFESSGKQPEEGIVLFLRDIRNQMVTEVDTSMTSQRSQSKEWPPIYNIATVCCTCSCGLRLFVSGSRQCVRGLEELFLSGLSYVCPACAAQRNGRR